MLSGGHCGDDARGAVRSPACTEIETSRGWHAAPCQSLTKGSDPLLPTAVDDRAESGHHDQGPSPQVAVRPVVLGDGFDVHGVEADDERRQ